MNPRMNLAEAKVGDEISMLYGVSVNCDDPEMRKQLAMKQVRGFIVGLQKIQGYYVVRLILKSPIMAEVTLEVPHLFPIEIMR